MHPYSQLIFLTFSHPALRIAASFDRVGKSLERGGREDGASNAECSIQVEDVF